MENLLDIARAVRTFLYKLTSMSYLGVEVDILLHFVFSGIIFAIVQPRVGTRRAAQLLAILIVAKEIADIFLKSQWQYIVGNVTSAPLAIIVDIVLDVIAGALGALVAWLIIRHRTTRPRAAADSSSSAA
jgi:hypothetical protein